jgi:hypothetical protein
MPDNIGRPALMGRPQGRDLAWRRPDGARDWASAAIRPNATGWPWPSDNRAAVLWAA